MYELVKQKNTGYRIILGIIIFAFITGILKIAFHQSPTTFNDDMVKAANEINSHTPMIIDSTLRFDRVSVLPGNIFCYNYTLLTVSRSQIDTALLKNAGHKYLLSQMKQNKELVLFKDNKVEIQARYADKNGLDITTVSVYPSEY